MEKLLRNKTAIILFMAPTLILFTAILLVPIATSFYYALCDYDKATRAYSFIGFDNFMNSLKLLENLWDFYYWATKIMSGKSAPEVHQLKSLKY